ncbi:MAG: hypothetical protein HLUCCX21_03125 [Porphyrobacter sp. HL-46]|nr:MAG: hypothetical protein HLUCCX21_03125 [Porphyrobacter sp. HL-46]
MIRVVPPPTAGLVQRLRLRAERIVARHRQSVSRGQRGHGHGWHSATALWPEFTDNPKGN